jgi:short-subunit dehydrogenase
MHVVITGASSGIGEALAREMGRAGHAVTLVARRRELLDAIAKDVGGECHVVCHDLSDAARATAWVAGAEETLGPIDVLVNNAGIENAGPTDEADVEAGVRLYHTNLVTPVLLVRHLLPAMLARRSGVIVNVASVAALAPMPYQAWYASSKAGLAAFSEGLGTEVRKRGVHVVTVYPGPVKTAMADAAYEVFGGRKGVVGMLPEGRADVLARRVRRAIEKKRKRIVYPRFYWVTWLFPWAARVAADLTPITGVSRTLATSEPPKVLDAKTRGD